MKVTTKSVLKECDYAYETIHTLKRSVKTHEQTIKDLEVSNKSASEMAFSLNRMLVEKSFAHETEKNCIIKDYENEVKLWKEELCQVNDIHEELEHKFNLLEHVAAIASSHCVSERPEDDYTDLVSDDYINICSLCSTLIKEFTPEYFSGEVLSPICENC